MTRCYRRVACVLLAGKRSGGGFFCKHSKFEKHKKRLELERLGYIRAFLAQEINDKPTIFDFFQYVL